LRSVVFAESGTTEVGRKAPMALPSDVTENDRDYRARLPNEHDDVTTVDRMSSRLAEYVMSENATSPSSDRTSG